MRPALGQQEDSILCAGPQTSVFSFLPLFWPFSSPDLKDCRNVPSLGGAPVEDRGHNVGLRGAPVEDSSGGCVVTCEGARPSQQGHASQ